MTPTPISIINDVAQAFGITTDQLRAKCRTDRIATARAIACYLLKRDLNMTNTDIAHLLYRNPSSVTHNVMRVEGFRLWPRMYATELAIIKNIEDKYFNAPLYDE